MSPAAGSPSIHVLMSRVMADIGAIGKDQRNEHFNYSFRGIDQIYNAVNPALAKNGVFYVPQMLSQQLELTPSGKQWHAQVLIRYRFYGPNGDHVAADGSGEALDSQDKALTKAQQAAVKYALLTTFCIATEEQRNDDPDSQPGHDWAAPNEAKARVAHTPDAPPPSGEVHNPCPRDGSECVPVTSSNPKAPKWKCPTCDWASWHKDPWKPGGEIETETRSQARAARSDEVGEGSDALLTGEASLSDGSPTPLELIEMGLDAKIISWGDVARDIAFAVPTVPNASSQEIPGTRKQLHKASPELLAAVADKLKLAKQGQRQT